MEELRKNAEYYLSNLIKEGFSKAAVMNEVAKFFKDVPGIINFVNESFEKSKVPVNKSLPVRQVGPAIQVGNPRNPDSNEEALRKYREQQKIEREKRQNTNPMRQLPTPWKKPRRLSASNETEEPSEASNFMASLDEELKKRKGETSTV